MASSKMFLWPGLGTRLAEWGGPRTRFGCGLARDVPPSPACKPGVKRLVGFSALLGGPGDMRHLQISFCSGDRPILDRLLRRQITWTSVCLVRSADVMPVPGWVSSAFLTQLRLHIMLLTPHRHTRWIVLGSFESRCLSVTVDFIHACRGRQKKSCPWSEHVDEVDSMRR